MKKNIMLISQSMTGGGAEKVVANLSLALQNKFNIIIVTYEKNEKEFKYAGERINLDLEGGNSNILLRIKTAIQRILAIKKIKKERQIHYAISFLPHTDYANIFSKVNKCKCIIEVSSNSSMAFRNNIKKFFRKIVLRCADNIIVVSKGSKQDLVNNFSINPNKIGVIYNSCDLQNIYQKINIFSENKKNISRKFIITIGSFRFPKGHWHLIKAFANIEKKLSNYDLVILGDGEYRTKYEELIDNLDIDKERIIMPGYVENPYYWIKNSDLFVFSSVYEGFGNVIIESMACGTPILSVDCDFGPREILSPKTPIGKPINKFVEAEYGWLFPRFDMDDIDISSRITESEKEFGNAIYTCISNKEKLKEYSEKGKIRSRDFSNAKYDELWLKYLNENN